ncbi:MAG: MBL fold metallo-hydrolase [Lachnospiraceae bacterium]|nr:MBL fold metallo-hydrolase [Lachnospiraceae bacterium]
MKVHELHYANTNTYLIEGTRGRLVFDTGWAGTFGAFCRACGELSVPVQSIDFVMISHFHPDHMGIAQEIANLGATVLVADLQKTFLHAADAIFAREKNTPFVPIVDASVRTFSPAESRRILAQVGIDGEVFATPGHSDDSISLWLDDGSLFVGDLNPLYELEMHRGTTIEESWNRLLTLGPKKVYYGHAKTEVLGESGDAVSKESSTSSDDSGDKLILVSAIVKLIDRGCNIEKICKKTGVDADFAENVMRMYLTHQNIGVQGILDRIELRDKSVRKQ